MRRKFEETIVVINGDKDVFIKVNVPAKEGKESHEDIVEFINDFSNLFALLHEKDEQKVTQQKENFFVYEDKENRIRMEYTILEDKSVNLKAIMPSIDLIQFSDIFRGFAK